MGISPRLPRLPWGKNSGFSMRNRRCNGDIYIYIIRLGLVWGDLKIVSKEGLTIKHLDVHDNGSH